MNHHPFPPDLGGLAPANATVQSDPRVEDLRLKLRRMAVYLDQILDDKIPATNPDHGSRCVRINLDGHPFTCRGCPLGPGGYLQARRNGVCRGVEAITKTEIELARIQGDEEKVKHLEDSLLPPLPGWHLQVPVERLAIFGLGDGSQVKDGKDGPVLNIVTPATTASVA